MTSTHQHPAGTVAKQHERLDATNSAAPAAARPRWLIPGLAVGVVAIALVVTGVLSVSSVLYAGLIGGMLLMHLGGHGGHGGHGSPDGQGHGDRVGGTEPGVDGPRDASADTQRESAGSSHRLDGRAVKNGGSDGQDDADQKTHGCH
ncbi:MAG: hypothetical protein HYX54_08090 [Chloroflexi bacterium]|nr:hypothetical protein [Chloroflexota bacterium]